VATLHIFSSFTASAPIPRPVFLRHVEKRGLRQRRYLPCAVIWPRPAHREKLAGVLGREWRQEIKIRSRHKKFDQVKTFLSSDDAAYASETGQ
jgi:hypothetical protein